jgi:hypothetical protein
VIHLLVVLLLLIGLSAPVEAAVVWMSGGETGAMGEWGSNSSGSNQTSVVRSGAYAYACLGNCTGLMRTQTGLGVATTIYSRFYWHWTLSGGIMNGTTLLMQLLNSSSAEQIAIVYTSGGSNAPGLISWRTAGGATQNTGTWPLAVATWYLIECKLTLAGGAAGGAECKIDGVTQFSNFAVTTNANGTTVDSVIFSGTQTGTGSNQYYDDIALSNSGYLGRGRILARQGAAGSPTYTAWTKNSCTTSLIENCWSQTPFNATPNASNNVTNAAQTMLTSTFASTQAGHGTETVGASDTINAAQVWTVAKAATGSQMKIRYRGGGADQDWTVTLTGVDAYYRGSIFTDTVSNLNASEIGAVNISGP